MQATSYILTYRECGDPARLANLVAVLGWLRLQRLAEVIVVEQDVSPTLGAPALEPFPGLVVRFAYNPGPFNKGWGFNVGARGARGSLLAFGDADLMTRSLPTAVAAGRAGIPVVRGFKGLLDLDEGASALLRDDLSCLTDPSFGQDAGDRSAIGERVPLCAGLVIMHASFFVLLGGWDERFLGWGGEDDGMDAKVARAGLRVHVVDGACLHLHHVRAEQAVARNGHYRGNLSVLEQLRTMSEESLKRLCEVSWQVAGNPEMHRPMEPLP